MSKWMVTVALVGLGMLSLSAASVPHFTVATVDTVEQRPCEGHGGLKGSGSLAQSGRELVMLLTCADDRLFLVTDQRSKTDAAIALYLDAPYGSTQKGTLLNASGWAFECGHMVNVEFLVDGEVWPGSVAHERRAQIADALGNICPTEMINSEVVTQINTGTLTPEAHTIQMLATDERGHTNASNTLTLYVMDVPR